MKNDCSKTIALALIAWFGCAMAFSSDLYVQESSATGTFASEDLYTFAVDDTGSNSKKYNGEAITVQEGMVKLDGPDAVADFSGEQVALTGTMIGTGVIRVEEKFVLDGGEIFANQTDVLNGSSISFKLGATGDDAADADIAGAVNFGGGAAINVRDLVLYGGGLNRDNKADAKGVLNARSVTFKKGSKSYATADIALNIAQQSAIESGAFLELSGDNNDFLGGLAVDGDLRISGVTSLGLGGNDLTIGGNLYGGGSLDLGPAALTIGDGGALNADRAAFSIAAKKVAFRDGSWFNIGADTVDLLGTSIGVEAGEKVVFESGAGIGLTRSAKELILANAGFTSDINVLTVSGGDLDVTGLGAAAAGGNFTVDTGYGKLVLAYDATNKTLRLDSARLDNPDPGNPKPAISPERYWSAYGVQVGGILQGSNFSQIATAITDPGKEAAAGAQNHYATVSTLGGRGDDTILSGAQAVSAFTSYTGHSAAYTMAVAGQASGSLQQALARHINDISRLYTTVYTQLDTSDSALASACFNEVAAQRFWVGGLGQWEELDSKNGLPGYDYDSAGIITGYDRAWGPYTAGASFGYSGGKFKDKSALANDSHIDNYSLGVYGSYNAANGIRAMALAGYTTTDNDISKRRAGVIRSGGVETAVTGRERSDYDVETYMLGGGLGYDVDYSERLKFGASAGLYYRRSRSDKFTAVFSADGGAGDSLLAHDRMKNHSLTLPVDVTADYLLYCTTESSLTLSMNAGYAYEFRNKGASGTLVIGGLDGAPRVDFEGRAPGRNTWNLGAGLTYENDRFDVGARYDYYTRSDYTGQRFSGNLGLKF